MFAVKVFLEKKERDPNFLKSVAEIVTKIKKSKDNNLSVVVDNSTIEIVSGNESISNTEDEVLVEFLVRKKTSISKKMFKEFILKEIDSLTG